jgi:hypothetical protein
VGAQPRGGRQAAGSLKKLGISASL